MHVCYLIDFNLAFRYMVDDVHASYSITKGAIDGMLLFNSIDQLVGALPSQRSDLQSLAYNLIFLLTHQLPWSFSECPNESDIKLP